MNRYYKNITKSIQAKIDLTTLKYMSKINDDKSSVQIEKKIPLSETKSLRSNIFFIFIKQ